MFTNNNTKHWCKCFWHAFQTNKTLSTKKWNHQWTVNIFIHFLTTESSGLMRFPHQYPPPRPWLSSSFASTAAFAWRSRWTTESWPLAAAMCSGVWPREPRPEAKPRAEPNGMKGRKFGHLKSRSFGNCGHSKILPGLTVRNNVVLRMFWWHRVGWKRPCEPGWQSKCFAETLENVPSLGNKYVCHWDTTEFEISPLAPTVGISYNRVRDLTHKWTGKT